MALPPPYRLSLFLLLVMPVLVTAQNYSNVSLGDSLTASKPISSWVVSPSQEFAFGSRQIETGGGYLLAIWFNKISERTIVWSANRDYLAVEGSKVELPKDGKLVLNDPKGPQIWSASHSGTGVYYAAMLDTGNFLLAGQDSDILWQSFDQPADTLLHTNVESNKNTPCSIFREKLLERKILTSTTTRWESGIFTPLISQ